MIRQDYILKAIEQFGQLLGQMINAMDTGKLETAWEIADRAIKELVGDDATKVLEMPHAVLMSRLMEEGPTVLVRNKCYILAAIFGKMGETSITSGDLDRGYFCFLKALHLLLEVAPQDQEEVAPDYTPKVEELVRLMDGFTIPGGTLLALMQHHERSADYGKAEDALHDLLARGGRSTVELGKGFYRRLLARTDDELAAGNLPREEVEAGLRELENKGG